jgi:hypothetical protein
MKQRVEVEKVEFGKEKGWLKEETVMERRRND